MPTEYVSISLPKRLVDYIDKAIESDRTTYRSRPDFIIETVRVRLKKLGIID